MSAQTHSPTAAAAGAGFAKLGIKYEIFLKRTKRAKLNASLWSKAEILTEHPLCVGGRDLYTRTHTHNI